MEVLGLPHGALDIHSMCILPVLQQGHEEADNQVNFGDEFVLRHLHATVSHSQTEHWGQ